MKSGYAAMQTIYCITYDDKNLEINHTISYLLGWGVWCVLQAFWRKWLCNNGMALTYSRI